MTKMMQRLAAKLAVVLMWLMVQEAEEAVSTVREEVGVVWPALVEAAAVLMAREEEAVALTVLEVVAVVLQLQAEAAAKAYSAVLAAALADG